MKGGWAGKKERNKRIRKNMVDHAQVGRGTSEIARGQ